MTSATEELRLMLDERGVEWCDESNGYVNVTTFTVGGVKWNAIAKHYLNSELDWMRLRSDESITPERAVAATLGSEREKALEGLVWDMWEFGFSSSSGANSINEYIKQENDIRERIAALGIEVAD